jgi:hypothetical protein
MFWQWLTWAIAFHIARFSKRLAHARIGFSLVLYSTTKECLER